MTATKRILTTIAFSRAGTGACLLLCLPLPFLFDPLLAYRFTARRLGFNASNNGT